MIEDPFLALTTGGIAALTIALLVAVSVLWIISAKRSLPADFPSGTFAVGQHSGQAFAWAERSGAGLHATRMRLVQV
jgi:hypothetical protein